MYDEQMVAPMRAELVEKGIDELRDEDAVNKYIENLKANKVHSAVVFINSVCGCAAGTARPGLIASLKHPTRAKQTATVFAGVDKAATDAVRLQMPGIPPSSPSIGFFREGFLVHFIERQEIEGSSVEQLQEYIHSVYEKFFGEEINTAKKLRAPFEESQIESEEVKKVLENKNLDYLFYDCRSEQERAEDLNAAKNSKVYSALLKVSLLLSQESAEALVAKGDDLKSKTVVLFSNNGVRSLQAVQYFHQHGFGGFKSLKGGTAVL